ncbi:MAG: hypothetical protein II531_01270 [Bacteroidales bacterium]|nr:hypothetical protein [Bacteroidales bacterium]
MAHLLQGINGPYVGKVGPVVGYLWKGVPCVRSYRRHINYPNTGAQQREKDWFIAMVRFAAGARHVLKLGLREAASEAHMTEGNLFVRHNKDCFHHDGETLHIDYEHLVLSQGAAADVFFRPPQFLENAVVEVPFEKNSMSLRASSDDNVYLYAYCPSHGSGVLSAPALRRSKKVRALLPEEWSGETVHLYGFVIDKEGRASRTTYIGMGRVDHHEDGGRFVRINSGWNDFVKVVERVTTPATGATPSSLSQQEAENMAANDSSIISNAPPDANPG